MRLKTTKKYHKSERASLPAHDPNFVLESLSIFFIYFSSHLSLSAGSAALSNFFHSVESCERISSCFLSRRLKKPKIISSIVIFTLSCFCSLFSLSRPLTFYEWSLGGNLKFEWDSSSPRSLSSMAICFVDCNLPYKTRDAAGSWTSWTQLLRQQSTAWIYIQ